ncbi:hypothetical protein HETIRDRAFT_309211 [Heterobasidion irregulare TC 32-1]|uniref:Uncharacterized protein n=1 Tax=Heterobasidion irregulare (strain TC 32-1) TaxID=747525 RepID=W4KK92_HETIT|nr:uncharacterized protein HETIRDRAFT_309211 [Heterobasidion irregulare TC 32-1]ETW86268.1 hypothetical protein HETIRDRAFT_309211 [Heterobasidion irregulare TC 32-1]
MLVILESKLTYVCCEVSPITHLRATSSRQGCFQTAVRDHQSYWRTRKPSPLSAIFYSGTVGQVLYICIETGRFH